MNALVEGLISNEELIRKAGFGFRSKTMNANGRYCILYKTVSLIDGMVYVGARYSRIEPSKDKYIGNGTKGRKFHNSFRDDKVCFGSHFKKYGRGNLVRQDLLFFDNYEDMMKAERIVVDQTFVDDPRTLNICLGGGSPPILYGKENGNYGNKWNEAQKQHMREKKSGLKKGSTNPNAKSVVLIDCWNKDLQFEIINSYVDLEKRFNYSYTTVSTTLTRKGRLIINNQFIALRMERFQLIGIDKLRYFVIQELKKVNKKRYILFQIKQGLLSPSFDEIKKHHPEFHSDQIRTILKDI